MVSPIIGLKANYCLFGLSFVISDYYHDCCVGRLANIKVAVDRNGQHAVVSLPGLTMDDFNRVGKASTRRFYILPGDSPLPLNKYTLLTA